MTFINCIKCDKTLRYKLGFNYANHKNAWCCDIFYKNNGIITYQNYNIIFKEKEDTMFIYTESNKLIHSQSYRTIPTFEEIETIIGNLIFQ